MKDKERGRGEKREFLFLFVGAFIGEGPKTKHNFEKVLLLVRRWWWWWWGVGFGFWECLLFWVLVWFFCRFVSGIRITHTLITSYIIFIFLLLLSVSHFPYIYNLSRVSLQFSHKYMKSQST